MIEVKHLSSLEWTMPQDERDRVSAILHCTTPPTTSHDLKIAAFANDPIDTNDNYHRTNAIRHKRHWEFLSSLAPCVTSEVQPALQNCRHVAFLFLHRGHISTVRSRQEVSLWGWTETQFEAVFGCLGQSDNYKPIPSPRLPATTFQAAWAGTGVYQSQIFCGVGPQLQDWCSFGDWPQRHERTHCGCALLGSTTMRFILELTVVFTCNAARVVGRKTEVKMLLSKATLNSKLELNVQPAPNKTQLPIRTGDALQKAQVYLTAMKEFKNALNKN